jgi:hypothetical protein
MPRKDPEFSRLTIQLGIEHRERFLQMFEVFGIENNTSTTIISSSESTVNPFPDLERLPNPDVSWITNQEGVPKVAVVTPSAIGEFEAAFNQETGTSTARYGLSIHRSLQGVPHFDHDKLFETCVVKGGKRQPVHEQSEDELLIDDALRGEGIITQFDDIVTASKMTSSPDTLELPPFTLLRADRIAVLADALEAKQRLDIKGIGPKAISFLRILGEAINPSDLIPPTGSVPPIGLNQEGIRYPLV